MIKVLGICGSPQRRSNTEQCVKEALKAAKSIVDVETELVTLAGLAINECDGCFRCVSEGTKERPCVSFDDDMIPLYSKLASSDGFIFASPTYFGDVSGLMKTFMDRFNAIFDSPDSKCELKGCLRFKPAGAIALGGWRNDGIEAVLSTFFRFFLLNNMVIVGTAGASNISSNMGGALVTEDKPDVLSRDSLGLGTVRVLGRKVALLAKMLNVGKEV